MKCKNCGVVNMADGTQVWVCKECGTENLPGEGQVVADAAAAQAAVNQAASTTPAAPAAPAAPVSTPGDMSSGQGPTSGQPAM